ncbi:uncharacterized protein LOC100905503 [Galendromus occidentalis]|uniref:Uncharacterized protein LOC100905503 n=1 Tax=Galendromus occidentalis TaxID=34638 RepID=A0AAJ6QWZ7_9ACAR|nr:uncharacterized protein LOC100905503 [Galendromus occidentalis]
MFGLRGTEVFQIIVLLVLCHVGRNGPSIRSPETCDRHSSAIVRHVVYTRLQPVLDRYRVSMPEDCPFHPARDVLVWPQRDANSITDVWRCPVCGKSFFGEENLTQHFHAHTGTRGGTQHVKRHITEGDRVCLGTFCDIMRCDVIERQLSEALTPRTSSRKTESPKPKADCNRQSMAVLENRCKAVMQQCTIGLLNVLSVKEYKDVEEALHQNICSYLTCERYWEEGPRDTRFSPFLASTIGFLIASGFFGCYWVVWIAFDTAAAAENTLLEKLPNGTTIRKVNSSITISRQRSAPLVTNSKASHRYSGRLQPNSYSQREISGPELPLRRLNSHHHRSTPYDHIGQHASQPPTVPAMQQPSRQEFHAHQQREYQQGSRFHYERPLRSPIKPAKELPSPVFERVHEIKEYSNASTLPSHESSFRRSRLSDFERDEFDEHLIYYPAENQLTFSQHHPQQLPSNPYAQQLQSGLSFSPQQSVGPATAALYEMSHTRSPHYEQDRTVERR